MPADLILINKRINAEHADFPVQSILRLILMVTDRAVAYARPVRRGVIFPCGCVPPIVQQRKRKRGASALSENYPRERFSKRSISVFRVNPFVNKNPNMPHGKNQYHPYIRSIKYHEGKN